jgi:hypothetical protein
MPGLRGAAPRAGRCARVLRELSRVPRRAARRPQRGLRIYDGIAALGRGATDPVVRAHAAHATGAAALLRGDPAAAALVWQAIADAEGRSEHWWVRVRVARTELGLGTASHLLHRDVEAAGHFERAIAAYRQAAAINEEVEYRSRLHLAEAGLAQVRGR